MTRILHYISLMIAILVFTGCRDDDWLSYNADDTNGELPVEFTFDWPGITATRGFDDATVKTKFSDQDVIHIVGTFKTEALKEDGSIQKGYTARYGALQYDAKTRQWNAVPGNTLTWPSISTEGKFYAYYISQSTGLITQYDVPVEVSLSDISPETDPLMAPETEYMKYGHAVNLQFRHLCSHLTLIDLEPMVASNYFFSTTSVGTPDGGTKQFNNAFKLTLVKNTDTSIPDLTDTPQLQFEFMQIPNMEYEIGNTGDNGTDGGDQNPELGKIFISGKAAVVETTDDEGEVRNVTKVGYFLEPGSYYTFDLEYPAIAPKTYKYLSYNYADIPPEVGGVEYENIPPDLEAGKTYTLTVTKSPGVTIVSPPPGDGWDDQDDAVDIDVREFLEAIKDGKEYSKDGTLILEAVPEGTKLLKNVDFKGLDYENFMEILGFLPDVLQGKTFDGNYHYISNLGCPLFRYNYGTIKNLGIKNVDFSAQSLEYSYGNEENSQDRSRHGALCMWNRTEGSISNVRISDVTMKIDVVYTNDDNDGNEVHNVGGVVGSNTGSLSEIYLGGTFTVMVEGSDVQNAEVLIGGVLGQNAGTGRINDIEMLDDDFKISITNKCQGELGMYSVGGIVGSSSGYITGVILSDVTINALPSSGVVSYLGGMAGRLDISDGSSGYMRDCIVSGTLTAGITRSTQYIKGQAYTGGIAGYVNRVQVTGCRSSVSVTGAPTVEDLVLYGTGGAFGRIASESDLRSLIAYGAKLQAPGGLSPDGSNYVGNFAGIGPADQTWEDNYAGNNLIFRSFNQLPPIGIFMSN